MDTQKEDVTETEKEQSNTEQSNPDPWANQPGGGRSTRGPEPSTRGRQQDPTNWEGEEEHGWAPDAPGTGRSAERVVEANTRALEAEEGTQAESKAPEGGFDVKPDPAAEGVGESTTRRGEDVKEQEGTEGREDLGTKGPAQRPYGKSSQEETTGVNPKEPIDEDMPNLQRGDQGG